MLVLCAALSGAVDSAYQQGADFLRKRVGLENPAIIAKTLDVAMNPNSLFVSFRDKKRSKNANVCAPLPDCLLLVACARGMLLIVASALVTPHVLAPKHADVVQARRLSVEEDMEPVVSFLQVSGLSIQQVSAVVTEHPPVLSYSIPDRLQPLMQYLNSVGVQDVPGVCSVLCWKMLQAGCRSIFTTCCSKL